MANFQKAYAVVHANEGGYANIASDKGGETYCGISRVSWPEWRGWALVDAYKVALRGPIQRGAYIPGPELKVLVLGFYKLRWDSFLGDHITSQDVANFIYDFHTNSGQAVRVIQQTLNGAFGQHLVVDNAFGQGTLAAVNRVEPQALFNTLKKAREGYVRAIVSRDASQAVHLPGWLSRINSFAFSEKKSSVSA